MYLYERIMQIHVHIETIQIHFGHKLCGSFELLPKKSLWPPNLVLTFENGIRKFSLGLLILLHPQPVCRWWIPNFGTSKIAKRATNLDYQTKQFLVAIRDEKTLPRPWRNKRRPAKRGGLGRLFLVPKNVFWFLNLAIINSTWQLWILCMFIICLSMIVVVTWMDRLSKATHTWSKFHHWGVLSGSSL